MHMKISEVTPLYHLSSDSTLKKLSPRVPHKLTVRDNAYEDDTIERVSFSPSIKGCILGLQLSEDDFSNGVVKLYVYEPYDYDESSIVSNEEIISKKLVFDAKVTRECWFINEVKVRLVGSITVYDEVDKVIEYKPIRVGDPSYLKANGRLDTFLYKYKVN